jgi:hypothetical protein
MTTQAQPEAQEPQSEHCPRDPEVETNLRCGKCGSFICPRCLVQTPVGARCPDCAKLKKNPAFDPSRTDMGSAVLASWGSGVAIGAAFGALAYALARSLPGLGVQGIEIIVLAGLGGCGWAVGEVTYRAAKFKRSRGLVWVAATGAFVVYAAALTVASQLGLWNGVFLRLFGLIGLAIGIYAAIGRVRP